MCKMLRDGRGGRRKRLPAAALLLALALITLPFFARPSHAENELTLTAPPALRPYAKVELALSIPQGGSLEIDALAHGERIPLLRGLAVEAGELALELDGLSLIGEPLPRGQAEVEATLTSASGTITARASTQVREPAAGLLYAILSREALPAGGGEDLYVDYQLSRPGMLQVRLYLSGQPQDILMAWNIQRNDALPHAFRWDRQVRGEPAPPGDYVLSFQARGSEQVALERPFTLLEGEAIPLPVTTSAPGLFLPETLDDKAVWATMMAPIVIVDIGDLAHQSIYGQADASGDVLGYVHGQTAGLEVLETDVNGFARVRAARHGDGQWVTGYIPQNRLKTLMPDDRYGLLIDKGAQTLTVYESGRVIGTMGISTGVYVPPGDNSFDTLPGAFLTQDRIAEFSSEGYRYAYAARIDGGNLIHAAGYRLNGGARTYAEHQAQLGRPASHGCVRVDNRLNDAGLNAWWLYANLPRGTKVLVVEGQQEAGSGMRDEQELPGNEAAAQFDDMPFGDAEGTRGELLETAEQSMPEVTSGEGVDEADVAQSHIQEAMSAEAPADALDESMPDESPLPGEALDGAHGEHDIADTPDFQVLPDEGDALSADTPVMADTGDEPLPAPGLRDRVSITLSFGGDSILGSEEHKRRQSDSFHSTVEAKGYAWPFSGLREIFQQDDLSMVNLENVLKDDAKGLVSRIHNFRGPTAFTEILRLGGVDLVNIANNHFVDYGLDGRNSTRRALKAANIPYAGYSSLHVFEKAGIRIGFAGIRETIFHQNRARIADEINELKRQGCHYIVYTCHFGVEYEERHNELQTLMARMAIDAGADLVIGHHPHVVQGIEEYEGGLIFYSLGNLVFGGNLELSTFDGLVAQVTLDFEGEELLETAVRLIPVITSGERPANDFRPVIAQGEDKARILDTIRADSEKAYPERFIVGRPDQP